MCPRRALMHTASWSGRTVWIPWSRAAKQILESTRRGGTAKKKNGQMLKPPTPAFDPKHATTPPAHFTSSSFLVCWGFNTIFWSLHLLWIHKESGNPPEHARYTLTPRTRMRPSLLWRNLFHVNFLACSVERVKLHRRILQNLHYSNQTN